MIQLSDLGQPEGRIVSDQNGHFESWLVIGVGDIRCQLCQMSLLIIAKSISPAYPGDISAACLGCRIIKHPMDMTMSQQSTLQDRITEILENGPDLAANSIQKLLETLASNLAGGLLSLCQIPTEFGEIKRGEEDAPIPKGYRSIAWLRRYEAAAILSSYKHKRNFALKNSHDVLLFQCNYFPDTSNESRKFHSNVQAIRINQANQRVLGWIRVEEARAVISAADLEKDVEFGPVRYGNGGMVQYFSESLEMAKKYRSTTRLLRKD